MIDPQLDLSSIDVVGTMGFPDDDSWMIDPKGWDMFSLISGKESKDHGDVRC